MGKISKASKVGKGREVTVLVHGGSGRVSLDGSRQVEGQDQGAKERQERRERWWQGESWRRGQKGQEQKGAATGQVQKGNPEEHQQVDRTTAGKKGQPSRGPALPLCRAKHLRHQKEEVEKNTIFKGKMAESNNEPENGQNPPVSDASDEEEVANEEEGVELVVLDPETLDVDLNHGKIAKIENLEHLRKVETISLRWNLIKKIENVHTLTTLTELELYDNQITKLENLDALVNLQVLDVSHNRIRAIEGLENLTNLKRLFLVSNKITKIQNISHLNTLEMLELGDNRIRKIENLDNLLNLKQLFLGKNKISKLENLDKLSSLTILSIQSNRIVKLEGLEPLTNLEELYISHNGLQTIEGLSSNKELNTLDMAGNRISSLDNLEDLENIQEFWFNDNQLSEWSEIPKLAHLKQLETVYFERNPIHRNADYRRKLKLCLPSLTQIDASLCR